MRLFLSFFCFCCLIFVCSAVAPHIEEIRAFRSYVAKYNKKYKDLEDNFKSLLRFAVRLRMINEHNKLYADEKVDYGLSINKFADLSESDIDSFTSGNTIPNFDFEKVGARPKAIVSVTPSMFPPGPSGTVDWNARGHVTPVKDQGYICNSCWAFSANAALESALSIYLGIKTLLSEQYLVDCNRNQLTGSWGCAGGSQASAYMNIMYAPGIPSSETYPYQENEAHEGIYKCRYNRSTAVGTTTGYGRIKPLNETLLHDVVAAVGPVAFALNGATETFLYYSSGIYNDPACRPGTGHSALIYGYGTARYRNGSTVDYWLCKNSWSTDWGINGHFRMIRGINMCGLTSYLIYPIVT